jgi:hypothetical protein
MMMFESGFGWLNDAFADHVEGDLIEAFGKPNLPKWVAPFGTALQSTE